MEKFYTFSINRRVYPKDKTLSSGPIYSEHFQEIEITGEDEKEFTGPNMNINKRSMKAYWKSRPREKYAVYTASECEAMIWMNDHRYKLMRQVERCRDIEILKQIAELVGYNHPHKG